jgi:preprotein translocase subunit YajC
VSPDVLGQLLPILLVVLLLFVMVIRPARRRAQQVSKLQAALSVGDEVMLSSGIFGTVEGIDGDRVRVVVADGVTLTVLRGAVAEILTDVHDPDDDDPDTDVGIGADTSTTGLPQSATDQDPAAPSDTSTHDSTHDSTHENTTRGAN